MTTLRGILPVFPATDKATGKRRGVLAVACGAHALHDGYTDLIYVLLPIWQTEFGLSYAALGALRMLCAGSMAHLACSTRAPSAAARSLR
jgi:MFS transporter, FSR family, fosmidomycin resistance protein